MEQNNIIRKINQIEQSFDVNSLYYKGVLIWPFIRQILANRLNSDLPSVSTNTIFNHSIVNSVRSILYYANKFMRPLWYVINMLLTRTIENNLLQYGGKDILFWSSNRDYVQKIDNKFFSPYIDPFVSLVQDKHSVAKLEINRSSDRLTIPRYFLTYFLNIDKYRMLWKIHNSNTEIEGIRELSIHMQQEIGITIQPRELSNLIISEYIYIQFYAHILSILRPKIIFLKGYFFNMALIVACRQLGIITVDLQHGVMNNEPGYSGWSQLPESGYNSLPDYFWTWGQYGYNVISEWQSKNPCHHKPIIGGHLWLSYLQNFQLPLSDAVNVLKQKINKKDKVILISLQYLNWEDVLPTYLLDAMKATTSNYLWLIRLHPLHRHPEDIQKQIKILKDRDIYNYEIEYTSQATLGELLSIADVHLTRSSATVYEALTYGVPVATFHSTGSMYFADLIENGVIHQILTTSDILNFVQNINNEDSTNSNYYAEHDWQLALDAIDKIIEDVSYRTQV